MNFGIGQRLTVIPTRETAPVHAHVQSRQAHQGPACGRFRDAR